MLANRQDAHEQFKAILLTVVGQAFQAAGYTLEQSPLKWASGVFRFRKVLDDGLYAFIEFQLLVVQASEWSGGKGSQFRVTLIRSDKPNASATSDHPQFVRKTLSELVVTDFGVAILPSADHWWGFKTVEDMGNALAEAGHLVVGYGLPWLAGDLNPSG